MKCKPAVYMDPNPDPRNLSKKSLDGEQTEEPLTVQTASSDSNALALFEKAFTLQIDKKYEQAIILYKQIIENYAFTSAAEMAVVRMARCYKKLDQKPNGKAELSQIAQLHSTDNLGLAASEIAGNWAIEAGHVDEGIGYYQRIVQSKTYRSRQALFELWSVYFHMTENKGLQSSLIKQYENDYGVDENLINMKLAMGLISGKEAKEWAIEQIEKDKGLGKKIAGEQNVPDVFALRHNYPNPFNPVTRIDYDIPKDVHVKMEIYNVLGQKIVVLVDRDTEAGSYTELWNATNSHGQKVGAGLYFCRITAVPFRKTKDDIIATSHIYQINHLVQGSFH